MPQIAGDEAMNKTLRVLIVVGVFTMGFVWGVAFERRYTVRPLQAKADGCKAEMEIAQAVEMARTHQPGSTFDYGEYRGLPAQLVVETDGGIILQLVYSGRNPDVDADIRGDYLDYLKKQVEVAVADKKGVRLRNGMTLKVEGYPEWGPHTSMGPNGHAKRLYFGEKATFNGHTIVVHGKSDKPVGYYPYSLSSS
jgi:hypothetical protein